MSITKLPFANSPLVLIFNTMIFPWPADLFTKVQAAYIIICILYYVIDVGNESPDSGMIRLDYRFEF